MNGKEKLMYIPTDEEITECKSGKGCSYGICDECSICNKESEEDESEE